RRICNELVADCSAISAHPPVPTRRSSDLVVGAADVGDVAVVVHGTDVTGVVNTAGHRDVRALRVAVVAGHQADGAPGQVDADLRSDEHTYELMSRFDLGMRRLLALNQLSN